MSGRLTAEKHPGKRQNDHVGRHVESSIGVVESRLVKASSLNSLVPVEVEGSALQEECYREGGLFSEDEPGETVQKGFSIMDFREAADEKEDDRKLDRTQGRGVEDLGAEATL